MKAIIFDFDGVIHDTFKLTYPIHKLLHHKSSIKNYCSYFEGNFFKKSEKSISQKAYKKFRKMEFEIFKNLKLEREIQKELEELSKKFELYIISSNSIKNLNIYFENSNFTNVFKEILAVEVSKSKFEKFKILFKKYNLDSSSCIFVTDTLGDILEANEIGIKSIACTFGFHDEKILKKGNPFQIISNFGEIRKIIENM